MSKESLSFEEMAIEVESGYRIKNNLDIRQFTRGEVIYVEEIIQKAEQITRVIEDKDLIIQTTYLNEEDRELEGVEQYPITIFGTSEVIAKSFFKLTIQKELLLPEHEERFEHVEAANIEFDIWMLNGLPKEKRQKILSTITQWERYTGLKVRFEGVVGK